MNYDRIQPNELSAELVQRWSEIQQSNSFLASPYFNPEFTQVVASVRDDVHIAVISSNGHVYGFFPFHKKRGGKARPLGLGLSDYHGAIVSKHANWSASELLKKCKITRYEFDHLLANQEEFHQGQTTLADSAIIDVTTDMAAYAESLDKKGRKQLKEIKRKEKKLTENIGKSDYTPNSSDRDILEQLMKWKSEQCHQTGTIDYFAIPWCRQLIINLHKLTMDHFGGVLATLHTNNSLLAAHFAMHSKTVMHSWFPTYNHEFQQYSPGSILLYNMIKTGTKNNIKYIDLGKGVSLYKKRVMTGTIQVAEGCFELPTLGNKLYNLCLKVESYGRSSKLRAILRIPGQFIVKIEKRNRFK